MIPRYDSVSRVLEGAMGIREKENFTEEYIKSVLPPNCQAAIRRVKKAVSTCIGVLYFSVECR